MDLRRLATTEAGRLDAAGHPESHQAPVCVQASRVRAELVDDQLEQSWIVTAVVDVTSAARWKSRRIGDLRRLDQVAPPQLNRVQVERARPPVHDPLHRVVAERPAAAADE